MDNPKTVKSKTTKTLTRTRMTWGDGRHTEAFEVRVMAVAEGWAMVRRKGCLPFVCRERDLSVPEVAAGVEVPNA